MEDRAKEAKALKKYYQQAKAKDPDLRHKILANGLGIAPSALAGWFNGHARCPDQALIWLADRLDFDPAVVRSDIHARVGTVQAEQQARDKLHALIESVDERKLAEITNFIRFIHQTRR